MQGRVVPGELPQAIAAVEILWTEVMHHGSGVDHQTIQAGQTIRRHQQQGSMPSSFRATPGREMLKQRSLQQRGQMQRDGGTGTALQQQDRLLPAFAVEAHLMPVHSWGCRQGDCRHNSVRAVGMVEGFGFSRIKLQPSRLLLHGHDLHPQQMPGIAQKPPANRTDSA